MAKKKKQKSRPNISPLSVLRPRLDNLFAQPGWAEQDAATLTSELNNLVADIAPEQYLPILLKAVSAVPEAVQLRLDLVLPEWLRNHELTKPFTELVQHGLLEGQEYEVAVAWLTDAGIAQTALQVVHDPAFYRAFWGGDEMDSQGFFMLFWYVNRQQTRVRGINVLIDFNPPWEGAAKDIVVFPQREARDAIREFVGMWESGPLGVNVEELDAVEAKKRFLKTLMINRENEIRLHKDFIEAHELLVQHLFTLPDDDETPLLTIEDFDELCQVGKATESIRHFEQRVGRLVRMEDGTEVLVGAETFLDEDDFPDQLERR
jgi:hypothetical protein